MFSFHSTACRSVSACLSLSPLKQRSTPVSHFRCRTICLSLSRRQRTNALCYDAALSTSSSRIEKRETVNYIRFSRATIEDGRAMTMYFTRDDDDEEEEKRTIEPRFEPRSLFAQQRYADVHIESWKNPVVSPSSSPSIYISRRLSLGYIGGEKREEEKKKKPKKIRRRQTKRELRMRVCTHERKRRVVMCLDIEKRE